MTELIDDDSCYYDTNYKSISFNSSNEEFDRQQGTFTDDVDNEIINTLKTIRETMDELDKEEPYRVTKSVRFDESTLPSKDIIGKDAFNSSNEEFDRRQDDYESEPLL
jgi:hypothetical protein